MKILVATGHLSEMAVRKSVGNNADITIADTKIAAFITPGKLLAAIQKDISRFDYDIIFIPGLCSGDFSKAAAQLGCRIRLGPKHAYDLNYVLPFADKIEFSDKVPACELLIDVRREMALKKARELEDGSEPSLMLGSLKLGGNSRMKVMAEVVDATGMESNALARRIRSFVAKGADIIDLGASLHATPGDVERAINVARSVTEVPVSIDTLDPDLFTQALGMGIDLILSLDSSNIGVVGSLVAKAGVPAVVIPDPDEGLESLLRNINAARSEGIEEIIADPVLDPIGHGFTDSIVRYSEFHRRFPDIPVFFGVGNVTELLDADSAGSNATLCGIGADVGASILFTPEFSNKAQGSVSELSKASLMMLLARERASSPKDLGIDLMEIKEKRRRNDAVLPEVFVRAKSHRMWKLDPAGSIRIGIIPHEDCKGGLILAEHEKVSVAGKSAGEVMDTLIDMGLVSRLEHAGYLGRELKQAEIALKFNRSYSQDDEF
ncbi:dihydropteroate synthase-like protein [Methanolobus sp.]|uniref:dihydropteroate synthase-like protein n=1 Tax=Methanolobus sp. TaxID=1874737 RepID=UPI0025CF742E|nr:dihydropteroate synthase-like protein [Methanolobus sp.]